MRSAAAKSPSHSATVTRARRFFSPAQGTGFFGKVARKAKPEGQIQAKLAVSKPTDPLEKEADRTAEKVMRAPAGPVAQGGASPGAGAVPVQRAAKDDTVLRAGEGSAGIVKDAQSAIVASSAGGQPLARDTREFMEPRLGADLGDVRVHADENAHSLSSHVSARAFTYRNHMFFNRGEYQPGTAEGKHLLAHELTHTVQQGAVPPGPTIRRAKAPQIQRTPAPVSTAAPMVQRFGFDDILQYFADKANYIPGFRMLTLVLGFNPITMKSVARTAANFLRALIEMVPGGAIITRVLDSHGVINDAAAWVEQKVAVLGDLGSMLSGAVSRFIDGIGWRDILDPGGVWDRAKRIVTDPIGRLIAFGGSVVGELLGLVKRAILRPLAALAEGTAGYDLLKAVLGQDPITGDPVPQDADALIGGFMKLIHQEEIWQNIKRGNAVNRAFAWFKGALAGLLAFVRSIPQRIVQLVTSLTFEDVITVVGAFRKVGSAFAGMVGSFFSWAGGQVLSLLEILVSVVAPGVMPYIAKAKAAFHTIIRDPVRFVGNLVRAGKLGFQNFAKNIPIHLQNALIKWITGPLGEAGVYIPRSFSLLEIVKLVLSVLGLTWQNIRTKLLKIIPEPVLLAIEKTAGVLVTLATEGPAAAWEQIKGELTELKGQLISQVTQMISTEIVKAAVTKLAMMLNPAGAVVQAIIATYNTVMFFVEKAKQIGAVIASFIDSIAAIAAGQVGGAAKRVEQTMANTLVVVLAFLARFAGLGGIPGKVVAIIKKIRAPIDRALDRIVAWLGKILDKVVTKAKDAAKKLFEWWKKKVPISGGDEPHTLTFEGEKSGAKLVVRSAPEKPSEFLKREHQMSGAKAGLLKKPLDTTEAAEAKVTDLQGKLVKFDEAAKTPTGAGKTDADDLSNQMNTQLGKIAKAIGDALVEWGVDEEMPPDIVIERPDRFTVTQKSAIAKQYEATKKQLAGTKYAKTDYLVEDSKGREINVAEDIDRRHVVSSDDMAKHYGGTLSKSKRSAAKTLVEQSGSISAARERVIAQGKRKVTPEMIVAAAQRRFKRYFGYARNIFLGPAWENQVVFKEKLDTQHPALQQKAKLEAHVAHVKRSWALDGTFTPSKLGE